MKRIKVFMNGCFDLFHDGHKHLFETVLNTFRDCKLLIAINSDEMVRLMKGDNRPSVCLTSRCGLIEDYIRRWCCKNMEYPDVKIVPFYSEEYLDSMMEEYDPDVIVKGNDRELKDIKGANRWPVFIVPRLKSSSGEPISTTNILERGYEK